MQSYTEDPDHLTFRESRNLSGLTRSRPPFRCCFERDLLRTFVVVGVRSAERVATAVLSV